MALRFRTRLTLTISTLVFLTVATMAITVAVILAYDIYGQFEIRGRALHTLTNLNMRYGIQLPNRVSDYVNHQMTVQGHLVAELVALAEQAPSATPEEITAALQRAMDRSAGVTGVSAIDEIVVTDEQGKAYIDTQDRVLDFSDALEESEEARFMTLLTPDAPPVVQDVYEQDDATTLERKYVGVSGVDGKRIVQVSSSAELTKEFTQEFAVATFLERFMLPDEFTRMAVVTADGVVLGAVDAARRTGADLIPADVVRRCKNYLRGNVSEPEYFFNGPNLGVLSPVVIDDDAPRYALYIEHRVEDSVLYIWSRVRLILVTGAVLILAGTLVGLFFSRGLSKPIVTLSKGAREFGKGNLNYRMYLKRKDEFQGLAQAFNTMAISLQEYMHELEQETSRRERLESEVRIASDIQEALLPDSPPRVEGLELVGWSKPSKEVGGDYYDFFELPDGRIVVALGDATGKGVSAALLVTQCSGILRTLAHEFREPGEVLRRTNNAFYDRVGQTHRFVTLFLMIIDVDSGLVQYASAGHPSPLLINKTTGEHRWLYTTASGFPLGIQKDAEFRQDSCRLNPEDTIVVFSDGLTDAQNPANELYGENRVESVLTQQVGLPLGELLEALQTEAESHMQGRDQTDDMTLVGLRFQEAKSASVEKSA